MTQTDRARRPATILRVIARLNIGGPARHVIQVAERMNGGPFRTILVKGAESPTEGTMEDLARERGVELVRLPELGREIRALDDWTAFWKLYRLMRRERPDVLHTHTAKAGALGRLAGLLYRLTVPGGRRLKIFHTFHGHVLRGYFGPWKSAAFRWTEWALARFSTRVITLTEGLRDELAEMGIAPRERIAVVPLGLELDAFLAVGRYEGREGPKGFRASLGVPDSAFLVGIVGRLVPVKDHETLFRAVAALARQGGDVRLAVVGDGERREGLRALARSMGAEDRIRFTGWRFDLPAVYAGLDAVALSSLNEGTPVSLIEALAAGVPVAATAVGGVPELLGWRGPPPEGLGTAERGLVVPPRDPVSLADALRSIREDRAAAGERAKRGRAFAQERFGVARLVSDLENLYRNG